MLQSSKTAEDLDQGSKEGKACSGLHCPVESRRNGQTQSSFSHLCDHLRLVLMACRCLLFSVEHPDSSSNQRLVPYVTSLGKPSWAGSLDSGVPRHSDGYQSLPTLSPPAWPGPAAEVTYTCQHYPAQLVQQRLVCQECETSHTCRWQDPTPAPRTDHLHQWVAFLLACLPVWERASMKTRLLLPVEVASSPGALLAQLAKGGCGRAAWPRPGVLLLLCRTSLMQNFNSRIWLLTQTWLLTP